MEQTAVEWLKEIYDSCNTYEKFISNIDWEQAKAMEKEQMNKNTNFICHGCGTKHTGENDDQIYEVCKQCFINL